MPRTRLAVVDHSRERPAPLADISRIVSTKPVSGPTLAARRRRCASRRARAASSLRPSAPPGCERAKSSSRKPRASSSATASASPSAICAVVLAVGARFSGHASSSTALDSTMIGVAGQAAVRAAGHRHQRDRPGGLNRRQDRGELVALAGVGDREHHVAGRDHAEVAVARLGRDARTGPACRWRRASPRSCGRRGRSCPCPSRPRGRGSSSIASTAPAQTLRPGAPSARAARCASISKVSPRKPQRALRRRRAAWRSAVALTGVTALAPRSSTIAPIVGTASPSGAALATLSGHPLLLHRRQPPPRLSRAWPPRSNWCCSTSIAAVAGVVAVPASLKLPAMLGYLVGRRDHRTERDRAGEATPRACATLPSSASCS